MVLRNILPEATRRRPPPRRHSSIDQHQLRCAFCLALSDYISSTFSIPLFVLFLQRGRIAFDRLDPFEAHKAEINPSSAYVLPSPYSPPRHRTSPPKSTQYHIRLRCDPALLLLYVAGNTFYITRSPSAHAYGFLDWNTP